MPGQPPQEQIHPGERGGKPPAIQRDVQRIQTHHEIKQNEAGAEKRRDHRCWRPPTTLEEIAGKK
jgi:hypothetical protein